MLITNNCNSLELHDWLQQRIAIQIYSEHLCLCQIQNMKPDLIISYNYKYIINEDIIEYMKGNIINLHISYLPWNRGSDPNIWSFIDNTVKGVTIHQISSGLDTGKILYQKQCFFDEKKETFSTSYDKLNEAIVKLLKEKWDEIIEGRYVLKEQSGGGSYHKRKELNMLKEKMKFDWNDNIAEFLYRYKHWSGRGYNGL